MGLLASITYQIILEISRSKCSPYPYPYPYPYAHPYPYPHSWHRMAHLCLRSARKLRNPNLECPLIL